MTHIVHLLLIIINIFVVHGESNSSLFESKINRLKNAPPNTCSSFSGTEFQFVISVGRMGFYRGYKQYVHETMGIMFTMQRAITYISIDQLFKKKIWYVNAMKGNIHSGKLYYVDQFDNLEDYNYASYQLWNRPSNLIVLTLEEPVEILTSPHQFPIYGKEGFVNFNINIVGYNNYEEHPREENIFIKMKVIKEYQHFCHMNNKDNRLCVSTHEGNFFITQADRGSPVFYGTQLVGIVTYVENGYAVVEKIFGDVPRC